MRQLPRQLRLRVNLKRSRSKPLDGEHLVVKKGFGGFSNTSLNTVLRNMGVTTCVVAGVMTSVCVSSTVRVGVEHNYRMIVVKDAVADVHRENHDAELRILGRVFADVKTIDEVVAMLDHFSASRDQGPTAV
jgi:nicotinamidase-related amidase